MSAALAVMAGGALGALARYAMASGIGHFTGPGFPWGTLAVNVLGGFIMGLLVEVMALKWSVGAEMRLFLTTGLLGGFTTFSAFSLEAATMIERGDVGAAAVYSLVSVVLCISAVFAGLMSMRVVLS